MHGDLIEKVKRIRPSALSDEEIKSFLDEAIAKVCDGKNDYAADAYLDDVLLYYALAQVSLYSDDTADYGNYVVLYNNALMEYRRHAFCTLEPNGSGKYQNAW